MSTRCTLRRVVWCVSQVSPSILWRILSEHWLRVGTHVLARLPPGVAAAAATAVQKALVCRSEAMGFARYRCVSCGSAQTICFTCKSRFCPTCGRARAQEAAAQAQSRLLNVTHRHLTFSVPQELRALLYARRDLLSVVARAAALATIEAIGTRCRKYPPVPGVMATVHTYGRDLGFHVHVHVLCTAGGLRADGVWQPVKIFPAQQYRRLWRNHLLTLLRRKLKGDRAAQQRIGRLFRKYPSGFNVNVMSIYPSGKKAAAYCCRYTGRPPLSEKRIVGYDGEQVTLAFQDYRDGVDKTLTLPVEEFLLRLLQHVWPRYQRDVHYYGLYQPSRRRKHVESVVRASRYQDQVRPVPPLSRRERMMLALHRQPLYCPDCGGRMLVDLIRFPERCRAQTSKGPPCKPAGQLSISM